MLTGKNIAILRYKHSVDFVNLKLLNNVALVKKSHFLSLHQQVLVNNICDLLLVKHGVKLIDYHDDEMIDVLLNSIACD